MDYVTIASTGNGTDFGDLTSARFNHGSASNSTTGLFAGGTTGGASSNRKNIIELPNLESLSTNTEKKKQAWYKLKILKSSCTE